MSNAPVFRRDQYSDLYGSAQLPVLEEVFRYEMSQHPSRRSELFRVVSTDRDIYQSTEMHDLDLFNQLAEGEEYSFVRSRQGASKTLSVVKYGLGFSISEEAVEDGKFNEIADMTRKLAKSAMESQEIQAMNIFNNGFSSETTADGVALFSTAHTLPTAATWSNRLATDADLSVTSLDQALTDFEVNQVGDSGIIYSKKPKILLVHSSQRRYALELIGSDLKADSSDNNMNSLKNESLRVISSPHLTDTDAWFLLCDPSEHGLRIIQRQPIQTMAAAPGVGFNTDSILYKSRYREKIGAIHAYGVLGTTGA